MMMPSSDGETLNQLLDTFNSLGETLKSLTQNFGELLRRFDERLRVVEAKYSDLETHLRMVDLHLRSDLEKLREEQESLKKNFDRREEELLKSIRMLEENHKQVQSSQNSLEISLQKLDQNTIELNNAVEKRLLEITDNISSIISPVENWSKEMSILKAEVDRLSREIEKKLLGE